MAPTPDPLTSAERVGLDVGGTALKAGRIGPSGRIASTIERAVPAGGTPEGVLDLLLETARDLGAEGSLGVGLPGLLDRERGCVSESPNLPALDGLAVREALSSGLGLPPGAVHLENDANVAALGEQWLGAARGETEVLVTTLGTGIGGGLILGGRLYTGAGLAGEIGHLTIDADGIPCGCGTRGCVETLSSATAARRRALALGLPEEKPGDLALLAERSRAGAAAETELLFAIGHDLGRGLGAVVCLLDIRCLVFSGGFSAALDTLEEGIRSGMRDTAYGERLDEVRILPSQLGVGAGWIGAARLAHEGEGGAGE